MIGDIFYVWASAWCAYVIFYTMLDRARKEDGWFFQLTEALLAFLPIAWWTIAMKVML